MSISERTLRKWRKEALESNIQIVSIDHSHVKIDVFESIVYEQGKRILQMTQVLLDQHLLNKGK